MSNKNQTYQRTRIEADQNKAKSDYSNFLNPIIARNADLVAQGQKERSNLQTGFQGFADTGGLDEKDIENLRNAFYSNIGNSAAGSANVPDFSEERGGYSELSKTGGYSGSDVQRIRAQAASNAPSFYGALRDQQALRRSTMGSNASAGAGLDFKLARASAQGAASDKLGANIGLAESVRAGRETGLAGLTNVDSTVGGLNLQRANILDNFAVNKASGAAGIESDIMGRRQYGKEFGLSGLQSLYGQSYKPQADNEDLWLRALGMSNDTNLGYINSSLGNDASNKKDIFGKAMQGVGAGAGLWESIKNLFKSKGGKPPAGTGGGGEGADTGYKFNDSLFRRGLGDPSNPDDRAAGEKRMAQLYKDYQAQKQGDETFEEWYARTHPGGK